MTVVSEPAAGAPALPDDVELDLSVRPQDDFYQFVNGHWTDTYVLPAHRAEATTLTLLSDRAEADAEAVILRAAGGTAQDPTSRRIADLYASFMDEDRIEELGAAGAFAADLETVRAAADPTELAAVLGRLQAQGVGGAVDFTVAVDTAEADGYVLVLSQAGLGLPAAAYAEGQGGETRGRYLGHLAVMWAHAGLPEPAGSAAGVLAMETGLAARHAPQRPGAQPRPLSLTAAELAGRAGGFPWGAWLAGLGGVPDGATVRMRQPGFLDELDAWWTGHSLDELKRWVCWRYVHEMVPFGPRQVFADNFAFYGQLLNGFTEPRPRRIRAVSFVETFLGDAVGERYVAEHLAPGTVEAATELVRALTDAYRRRLERAGWMSGATREAALRKLDGMVFEIGHPRAAAAAGPAGADPGFDPADLVGNVKRGRARHIAGELVRLGGPVDRSEWKIHPHQVTAYYRHGLNQVVVPAGLLQPPVFDPAGDPARNFAVLGAIIGHEMSHAFDNRGSRYDGQGRLRDWWAPADRAEFTRRTALLVAQYDGYEPAALPGRRVSGARTVGENMADIAGVTVALDAYGAHAGGVLDTARTRVFLLHWATMWRARTTPARLAERLASPRHPHPPAEFRCNGVLGHLDAFYEAFDVRPGDALFLAPASRFSLL
ncbi:M13 family metallopeptidase (plasmid) [Streptomyces sp. NBC_00435]|uniref:M13 family metallopeptidase n=1 Tax=Streptomyces sp. NBC_00435 TaxID=2903649 RepID=UPI002E1C2714